MYIWLVNLLKHNSNIQESLVLFRTSCSTGWFRSKMTPPSGFNCAGRKHSHLIFYWLFPLEVLHGVIHISKPVNPAFWSRQDTSWPTLSTTPSFLDPSSGDYHHRDFHYHHRIYIYMFRVLIVLYSDRGLVVFGETRLNLLHQLYWWGHQEIAQAHELNILVKL